VSSFARPPTVGRPLPPGPADPCAHCPARGAGPCGAAGPRGLERFARDARQSRHAAGDAILHQDEAPADLITLIDGVVKQSRLLPDGRRQIVNFSLPGDLLGLVAADSGSPLAAEAVTPVRLCRLRWPQLESLVAEFPAMQKRLRDVACAELAAAQDHIVSLGRRSAVERLAHFLVGMHRRTGSVSMLCGAGPASLRLPMSQAEIAEHLGLRLETVSRAFGMLRRAGLVQRQSRQLFVLPDLARLRGVSEGAGAD